MEIFSDDEWHMPLIKELRDITTSILTDVGAKIKLHNITREEGETGYYFHYFNLDAHWIKKMVANMQEYANLEIEKRKQKNGSIYILSIIVGIPLHKMPDEVDHIPFMTQLVDNLAAIATVGLPAIEDRILTQLRRSERIIDERFTLIPLKVNSNLPLERTKDYSRDISYKTPYLEIETEYEIIDEIAYKPPENNRYGGYEYERIKNKTGIGKK